MALDVITIGRSSVDLYGAQIGGRLEDMRSFSKYIGGSPTNIASGCARLGLAAALITRVGDEHMGRFVREQLVAEGVDVRGVITDPERLTALVLLGIRDREQFPLIFYREDCADMALSEADIDPALIAETRCLTVTGTHLSNERTAAAVRRAIELAKANGARIALDIDFRPNLWGLAGHGDGESRFVASEAVTARFRRTLPLFDLVVGTEEEFHIAGGDTDTLAALRAVRESSDATLVCKRGPMGAVAFTGPIGDTLDDGLSGPGFAIEVFNVLGAGDGFMAGLLKGWLDDVDWVTALTWANACGALAVSRHGCAPAYPSGIELRHFLAAGVTTPALRHDAVLEQIHHSTTRRGHWPTMRVFAFDHRAQFEALADDAGVSHRHVGHFKRLCLTAALAVRESREGTSAAAGAGGYGILCDARLGEDALFAAASTGFWIGRPVERPGSRPLTLEIGEDVDEDLGGSLAAWPSEHVVKVLCVCHPDDDAAMRGRQEATLLRLARAARAAGLEFLLEIIPSQVGDVNDTTTANLIERIYALGIFPDWWKLEPMRSHAAWARTVEAIERHDPHVRGIVVLGLDAEPDRLQASFVEAARFPLVKGFAVGRTIFGESARRWFCGEIDDAAAVTTMSERYAALCDAWDAARDEATTDDEVRRS